MDGESGADLSLRFAISPEIHPFELFTILFATKLAKSHIALNWQIFKLIEYKLQHQQNSK
jgi:hypothetical protein